MCIKTLYCSLLLVLGIGSATQANAQFVGVESANLRTITGISFTVRLERANNKTRSQDTRILLTVLNRSSKAIYVVKKKHSQISVKEGSGTIDIAPPYPIPVGHGDFDFTFHRVAAGKVGHIHFDISRSITDANDSWVINTGIGFIESTSGLVPAPRAGSDPAPWRAELFRRLRTVTVGSLTLNANYGARR